MSEKVQKEKIEEIISKLENKDFGMYFFVLDTKGNPTAGIANTYEHVKVLRELGYNAQILHEKPDYKLHGDSDGMGISNWLGEEYANLPHVSVEGGGLNVGPQDFIFIPEIFANLMDQIKAFPCKKVVFSQSYDYLLELLPAGRRWTDYGFSDVITTSSKQGEYIRSLFPSIKTHVVPVSIPSMFKDSDKPKVPKVALLTRDPRHAQNIAKQFILQYPLYKWIDIRDLRGMSRDKFAEEVGQACLAVWIDDSAGFGTFPLEAMECNTPVIGKMPNMIPEWMEEDDPNNEGGKRIKNNGVWTNTMLNIPELMATYIKLWLEDNVPADLVTGMESSKGQYTEERQVESIKEVYGNLINDRIEEMNNTIKALAETTEA